MTVQQEKIQSPLARARGMGAAHEGAGHWWHQRVTAIANIPLMLWLMWSVAHMPSWSYGDVGAWLAVPCHAILMILAVMSVFYHALLGLQVVIEDYVHCEAVKIAGLIGLRLFFIAAGVACVFCILKVAFVAG